MAAEWLDRDPRLVGSIVDILDCALARARSQATAFGQKFSLEIIAESISLYVHHAADGVRSVKRRAGTAQHFHLADAGRYQIAQER